MTRIWLWLRSIFFRGRLDRDIQDELSAHLRHAAERFEASGLSPDDARAAARRAFGNVAAIEEETRDAWAGRGLASVLADLRYGLRGLSRTPFSALTMILIFALGIGCNGALFLLASSFVNSPVPGLSHDASLVRIRGIQHRAGPTIGREFSYPEYRDYLSQKTLFASVAAWTSSDVVLGVSERDGGQETLLSGAATYVTANYFQVLGVPMIRGAGLPSDIPDHGGEPPLVAVISHAVWERSFGRAADIIGRPLKVNQTSVTIVGVAPKRFSGARIGGSLMRVWLPLSARSLVQHTATDFTSYDPAFLGLAARLQPGIEVSHALPTVEAIGARSMQLMTVTSGGTRSTDVAPMLAGNYFPPSGDDGSAGIGRFATVIMPLLVLLVTCTNVSALLAGLGIARRREIAVRLALGAARRRIVRQLVTESVLLAVAAGVFALFVIWAALQFVESTVAEAHLVIDWRTIFFTFVIALVAGIGFGLSPALHGTRVSVSDVLKDAAGGVVAPRSRLQSLLVVAQIAFTQPVLLGMGSVILEIREDLQRIPSSPHAHQVLDVRFNTNPRYGALDRAREEKLLRLRERLAAMPGVVGIAPQEDVDDSFDAAVHRADRTGDDPARRLSVRAQAAPAGYFGLMGIPIVRGRDFEPAPREDRTSIVMGARAASRLWPGMDPIGRRLFTTSPTRRGSEYTVIGVVDDASAGLPDSGDDIRVFVSDIDVTGHLLIKTHAPAQTMLPSIRARALAEAPDLPLVSAQTLAAVEASQRSSLKRAIAGITGIGVVALFLSAIGLYAVVAFAVRQRVREIGIRTALGAERRQVVRGFVLRGLKLGLLGMAVGLTLSVIVVRVTSALQGEEPPSAIIGLAALVACVAIAVTLLATWVPARRAAAVDPLLALRAE